MTEARITHIGGPTALVEVDGWRILTDPTFDPPGQRYFFGWGTTSRKVAGPSISPDELGPIDAVLVSHHHHGDNLDPSARDLLPRWGRVFTTKAGAKKLGGGATGLAAWDTTTLEAPGKPTITITATPCRHGPAGSDPITGPVVGFDLTWDGQEHGSLWVTGDTVFYRGLRDVAERRDVGTVLLHLGGVKFRYLSGGLRYTMDAKESLKLLDLLGATHVVPVHYEGWTHFKQGRSEAQRVLDASRHAGSVTWVDPGEAVTVQV
ncbi:MBL fold metallo-hydrolase [Aeromicrobium terrae]|jgi:L-ascorbate metabolism protein UlaG (beta-lactamase superfamily)|uniref:MBL fold metallo-hydrolase n=1 Tax=Aeromicrobium terrae TaxID=2498846 RepID=A0A5C8NNH4_9ACTN|nr:MBL fold metallo-hydrolase [Aeromicrobium terrae]TXL62768.1 MBL fold metallo-hydrolase [Aeromicrobium terrae]